MSDEEVCATNETLCPLQARVAGRPKAAEAEARLQELVAIAGELFLEKGYSKVSLDMIARRARVAVRTIYVKFGGKSGLFREVLLSARHVYFASMEDMQTDQRPIRDVLMDFGRRVHEMLTTPAAIRLYRIVIAEAQHDPELGQAFFEAGPAQTRGALTRFFSRPDVQPKLRDVPPAMLAVHFMNSLMGDHLKRYLLDPTAVGCLDAGELEMRVDLFLHGVQACGAASS